MADTDTRTTLIAERDELVTELRTRWPGMAADMADLLTRLSDNERATRHAGLAGAEAIARGVIYADGHPDFAGLSDLRRLGSAVIPQLDASTPMARETLAWPR